LTVTLDRGGQARQFGFAAVRRTGDRRRPRCRAPGRRSGWPGTEFAISSIPRCSAFRQVCGAGTRPGRRHRCGGGGGRRGDRTGQPIAAIRAKLSDVVHQLGRSRIGRMSAALRTPVSW